MNEPTTMTFPTEGAPAFPVTDTGTEQPAASSAEETVTEQTPSSPEDNGGTETEDAGGERGFADHPRWKERESDWQERFNTQETRHADEIARLRTEFDGKISGIVPKSQAPVEVPAWFGGDENQWSEFQQWNDQLAEKVVERATEKVTSKTEAESKRIAEATEFLNSEITAIESDKNLNPAGERIDRNRLLKTVQDYQLVDTEGRWNYKAGYAIMRSQAVVPAVTATRERKAIASATTSESRPEPKKQDFMTGEDFRKPGARPW